MKNGKFYNLPFFMAAGLGFEPRQTESESAVLPLHNPASRTAFLLYYNFAICQELSTKNFWIFPRQWLRQEIGYPKPPAPIHKIFRAGSFCRPINGVYILYLTMMMFSPNHFWESFSRVPSLAISLRRSLVCLISALLPLLKTSL